MRKLWFRRKAVSTIIGGIIILTVFLSALTAMVVISQQYDAYQNISGKMSQKDIDRLSENVTALYPGLALVSSGTCTLCQYDLFLSNLGGVGAQIVEIYINSTLGSAGCTVQNVNVKGACILHPSQTASNFVFNVNDGYLNAGEFNHTVRFWLPFLLPNPGVGAAIPANTIWFGTTRGRVFTFQWPFPANPLALPGFSPNIIRGDTKIAYVGSQNGFNSQLKAQARTATWKAISPGGSDCRGRGRALLFQDQPYCTS